jgi:hypothetical protein
MIDFTGVTAITIPEGVVKKITRGTEVLWEVKVAEGGIVMGDPVYGLVLGASYGSLSITYATECVNNNGALALGGTTQTVKASSASQCEVIRGHYVMVSNVVYYIPDEATFSYVGNNINKSYDASIAYPMMIAS